MGPCNSIFSTRKSRPQPAIDHNYTTKGIHLQPAIEKKINHNAIIENYNNMTIIRSISDINGDAIKIEKCNNCTIIIMDYSGQVNINDCHNCTFFIAPCKGSIYLNKLSNIKIISASSQFRCRDVTDSKASIFSASKPALERVSNLKLSCFCFTYTELQEMFSKADLSIWDNCWSEYTQFSQSEAPLNCVKYFEVRSDDEFQDEYNKALKDQEISLDQYDPVPHTYGLSHAIDKETNHMLFFLRESHVDITKLGKLLELESLNDINIFLIKTCCIEFKSCYVSEIENILKRNKNSKSHFFSSNNAVNAAINSNSATGKNSNLNIKDDSDGAGCKNNYVMLWFVTDEENFESYTNILEDELEEFVYILKSDFEEVGVGIQNADSESESKKKMKDFIKMLFNDYDI